MFEIKEESYIKTVKERRALEQQEYDDDGPGSRLVLGLLLRKYGQNP